MDQRQEYYINCKFVRCFASADLESFPEGHECRVYNSSTHRCQTCKPTNLQGDEELQHRRPVLPHVGIIRDGRYVLYLQEDHLCAVLAVEREAVHAYST